MTRLSGLEAFCRRNTALRMIGAGLPILLGCLCVLNVSAAQPERRDLRLGNDQYSAGDELAFATPVTGDLFAAGGKLAVDADVGGMVVIAGGELSLNRETRGNVFAAGRDIRLNGRADGNVRMAGGRVNFNPQSTVAGNATLAGRNLELEGSIGGYLLAAGQRIFLNGRVDGDVMVAGETIELGPEAMIRGRLTYRAEEFKRADGAQVEGDVEARPLDRRPGAGGMSIIGSLVWALGLAVVGAICISMSPLRTWEVSETIRGRFGMSLGYGLLVLIGLPIAAAVAMITLIGIPLGLLLLFAYPILLLLGYVHAGIALGDTGLRRFRGGTAFADRNPRILGALAALVLLMLIALIPYLGFLICLLAATVGAGGLVAVLRKSRRPDSTAASAPI